MTALVVAALAEEVAHLDGVEILVTGVGKAVAAAALSHRLAVGQRPSVVVNVGTAGALDPDVSGVLEVGFVTQHDFPYLAIEALTGPADRAYALVPGAPPQPVAEVPPGAVAVASGDVFVADAEHARAIAARGISLVDMEAYAYAAACAAFAVPMRCVKAVSDFADADAGDHWLDTIDGCARALADWVAQNVR